MKSLKENYQRLQAAQIAALNGIGRRAGTPQELADIETALQVARKACVEAGIEVTDTREVFRRMHEESEAKVRSFAAEQQKISPMLSHSARQKVAYILGFIAGLAALALMDSAWRAVWAIAIGFAVSVICESFLADYFPTPAVRIGRMAHDLDVSVGDLFEPSSPEYSDYLVGRRMQRHRQRKRGESADLIRIH